MPTHAKLSPSSSTRWLNCPGSVAAIQAAVERGDVNLNKSSDAADEGSNVHMLCEKTLNNPAFDPHDFVDRTIEGFDGNPFTVEFEHAENVWRYIDYIRDNVCDPYDVPSSDYGVEDKVPLFYSPQETGTIDFWFIDRDNECLHVVDYKNGHNVYVPVEDNTQLVIYGVSKLIDMFGSLDGTHALHIHVVQPNKNNMRGQYIEPGHVCDWADRILTGSSQVDCDSAPCVAGGKQCQWCPLADNVLCDAYTDYMVELTGLDFDNLDEVPDLGNAQLEKLVKIFNAKTLITKWLGRIEGRLFAEVESRGAVDGIKLVRGRANRAWAFDKGDSDDTTESRTVRWLQSRGLKKPDLYPQKLTTPTQVEKMLKKAGSSKRVMSTFEKYVVRPKGKLTLVPEDDPRPAEVVTPVEDAFDDLSGLDLI